ncbi:hypothetical protein CORC01_00770 [Colletotrichum orchidophilum]|uniref:Uncharacterized protein n=1 Tax=Colletotrichum orchidophilum TaxID=1209926 RepID=A0A1G4BRB3_9PEZI|nr:hypothetical protein CORC01_00770 [Colletotrichum orchidophilum]
MTAIYLLFAAAISAQVCQSNMI